MSHKWTHKGLMQLLTIVALLEKAVMLKSK